MQPSQFWAKKSSQHTLQLHEYIRIILTVELLLVIIFIAACRGPPAAATDPTGGSPLESASGEHEKILHRSLPSEPLTLDPQLADDTYSNQVVRDLYEGLTTEDSHGLIVPGVAKSWTVDPTGIIYTFELRKDAKWSNGTSVVAEQFVEGLHRAVDPKTASGSAALLTIISGASKISAGLLPVSELGVRALGSNSIQIRLEHPAPYLLQVLAQPIAAPVYSSIGTLKRNSSTGLMNPITNGPYILVRRVPGSQITLSRNIYYWDRKNVSISKVSYINAESESTELKEYLAGQLDLTSTIPMPDLERVLRDYPTQVQMAPILGTFYLALNLADPPFKNAKDLRKALSMTIEREAIANHVMMGVTPAYCFVAKGMHGYVSTDYEWATWTPSQRISVARTLFEQAGYSSKNPLHLKIYFNRDDGVKRIMTAVATGWKENLGVESELISDEFRVFLEGRKDHTRWNVARLGWNADYDDPASFLEVFSSGNGENDAKYKSAAFDDLISRARGESSTVERIKILQEAETVLLDDYPIIPIYFYKARRLVKPNLGGAEITPMNHTYSKHFFWKSP